MKLTSLSAAPGRRQRRLVRPSGWTRRRTGSYPRCSADIENATRSKTIVNEAIWRVLNAPLPPPKLVGAAGPWAASMGAPGALSG
jgi:hypothetical protein